MARRPSIGEGRPLLDIASYGRRGPRDQVRLSAAEIELIHLTVSRAPEVMVKVSGGGRSTGGVRAHFSYIGRHGDLDIETDDGERLSGRHVAGELVADWDLDLQAPSNPKGPKLVHNLVFSMPARTPPDKLLAAVRALAREEFALKHRYAMVLHTDQDHPHVHMVVKAVSEDGRRLSVRKATLRWWRQSFARHLRMQGIVANATQRQIRGRTDLRLRDGAYRAARRGVSCLPRVNWQADSERNNDWRPIGQEDAKPQAIGAEIREGWRILSGILKKSGYLELGKAVKNFADEMGHRSFGREFSEGQPSFQHPVR